MKRLLLKIISAAALTFLFFFNSANAATLTIASVGTTAGSNGLSANPLSINQTGIAVMGFSTKGSGTISATQFVFTGSSAIITNFSNLKLYSSANSTYTSGTDPLVAGATSVISGSTITFSFPAASAPITTTTTYYFLVADYTVTSSTSSTYTFSVTGVTSAGNTLSGLPKSGPAYTLSSATCDWTGATNTTWTTASNWSNNHVPGPYDNVDIAVNVQISGSNVIPVISASTTIASLKFAGYFSSGGTNFPGITVNGAAVTLTVTGDMTFDIDSNPGTFDYTATPSTPYPVTIYTNKFLIGGTGTISATNLFINANYGGLATAQQAVQQAVISSIANLTISGNLSLTSENYKPSGTTYNQIASFYLTGGTTVIGGKINMTNTVSGTTVYPVSGVIINPATSAGATLQLDDPAALSNLTANGINYFDWDNLYAQVNYTGTVQTIYTSTAPNVYTVTPLQYYDLTLSGGTQTPTAGTITVVDNFTSTATAANFNTNNTALTVGQTAQISSGVVNAGSGAISVSGPTKILSGATLNAGTATASSLTMSGAYTNSSGGTFTAGGGQCLL